MCLFLGVLDWIETNFELGRCEIDCIALHQWLLSANTQQKATNFLGLMSVQCYRLTWIIGRLHHYYFGVIVQANSSLTKQHNQIICWHFDTLLEFQTLRFSNLHHIF